ncbi:MAG: hypothetical protein IPM66_05345 [Acidobacteriota bacterium]|nr:MAG: hypothetical protein IPM66_05345 [Acidobacteriota bacterium]
MQDKTLSDQADDTTEAPPCCGTGCVVCVLDYREGDAGVSTVACPAEGFDSSSLQLLEAIEDAQMMVRAMLDRSDSE